MRASCSRRAKRRTLRRREADVSQIKEHAELFLLLSMLTPVSWLERNPTYKEQQQQLDQRDLATYGFLGYPVLQAADIIYIGLALVIAGAGQAAATHSRFDLFACKFLACCRK